MARYNIKGEEIDIAKCVWCGNEVDVTDLFNCVQFGLSGFLGNRNTLVILDVMSNCCDRQKYTHVDAYGHEMSRHILVVYRR